MAKNLETRAKKAVLKIEEKVVDISNVMYDISAKLSHIIKSKRDYYGQSERDDYYK
jgi:hypothetical protein